MFNVFFSIPCFCQFGDAARLVRILFREEKAAGGFQSTRSQTRACIWSAAVHHSMATIKHENSIFQKVSAVSICASHTNDLPHLPEIPI
jgi:hypothetical protein